MKKLSYLLALLMLGFTLVACRESLSEEYDGESLLHFSNATTRNEVVLEGSVLKEVTIPFSTIKELSSNQKVTLVVDQANSTAVEGVDFDIVTKTVDVPSGKAGGEFVIKLYESAAGTTKKIAVFKLKSDGIKNAVFDQSYKLAISLFCPISSFVGSFTCTSQLFDTPFDVNIVEGPEPGTLLIKDFLESNYDIKLNYDLEGNITFDAQETGYVHSNYGMISIRPAAGKKSTFNTCERTLTLNANYFVSAGTFGDKVEIFTGK